MPETVIETNENAKDGQTKCPKCGATDISLNSKTGKLRCNFCRHEFEPEIEKTELDYDDITKLEGEIIGSGAKNISDSENAFVTIKCSSCGAEVVIDTNESTQARCHWCRNVLSINEKVPNGAVPDAVLPFSVNKNDARGEIEKFVSKRRFYAHPTFKQEFSTENIMGVYLPYMIVDVNAHATFIGEGEHETRCYTVGDKDNKETRYDADLYHVERDFDLTVDDLTIESSSDKLNRRDSSKTNNIINSIMPFDTENCVKWDANYLRGFSSEKRDTDIDTLKPLVKTQVTDIARHSINDTLGYYDRGVRWDDEELTVKGSSWKTAYLPVWLYSYLQKKNNGDLLHYVAVNARTKETMGSVPIYKLKLLIVSAIIEIIGIIIGTLGLISFYDTHSSDDSYGYLWLAFYLLGVIYYVIIYARYRNWSARHSHESETKHQVLNLQKVDVFIKKRRGLSNSRMNGANNTRIRG